MEEKMELVAKTFQGLEDVLADELRQLGAEDVTPGTRMVAFKGNMEICKNKRIVHYQDSFEKQISKNISVDSGTNNIPRQI